MSDAEALAAWLGAGVSGAGSRSVFRLSALTAALGGATETRIAHLLGDNLRVGRPPRSLVVLSLLGAVGAVWLVMCLGQGALAAIGM
ncbi:MAG: hypothetical protein QOF66_6108 [Mycobacterium sp.]|nr:hypothetical protein [Mycobacterium sp.]